MGHIIQFPGPNTPRSKPLAPEEEPTVLRDTFVCSLCGGSRFHLLDEGSVACDGCRHIVLANWQEIK